MSQLINKLKSIKRKHFPSASDKAKNAEILQLRTEFYRQFVKEGDVCFDVGANVGNRVQPLLNIGAKVIAVEPQKDCCKILEKKFGNAITIVSQGLGAEESTETLYIANASTISSFSKDWIESVQEERFKNYRWNKTEEIEMTTLEKLIETYSRPTFIKIDVEGYELEVLKGLKSAINTISFEYVVPEQTDRAMDCVKRIAEINADTVFNYSVGESMEFEEKEWISSKEMINLIATKKFTDTLFGDIYARMLVDK